MWQRYRVFPRAMSAASGSCGDITVRAYGASGPTVVVLHGGPGAAGYMAPVCRQLSYEFTVIEPLQRPSGRVVLTVDLHIADLRDVIHRYATRGVTLVGHSWGAMLALTFAARHPGMVSGIVLIGCGTFDPASREILESTVEQRMTAVHRDRLRRSSRTIEDEDVRMCVVGRILEPVYSYELAPHADETEWYDARGHRESWADMLRLQQSGVYPAEFRSVRAPVLMLHGDYDPHPGQSTFACLRAVMPQLEYVELERCGHYPWWESSAHDAFFEVLRGHLAHCAG
jgi:pimeloyl-ACP methyl ester carboxylesterase